MMKTAQKTIPFTSPLSQAATNKPTFVTNILRLLVWITSSISAVSCIFWIAWSCYVSLGASTKPDDGLAVAATSIFFAFAAWLTSLAVPKHAYPMARKAAMAALILLAIAIGIQIAVAIIFALKLIGPWFGPW